MFNLHKTLAADTFDIGAFQLCTARLMNNSRLPWVILVPQRNGIRESYELSAQDQALLLAESCLVSQSLMREFKGDKLNVGSLGNLVPQLHVHHVVRYSLDPVWPNPVWGNLESKPYTFDTKKTMLKRLRKLFATESDHFTGA